MSMRRIREQYNVPARRGHRVKFRGIGATILSADKTSAHLFIQTDQGERLRVHPTWEMDYSPVPTPSG